MNATLETASPSVTELRNLLGKAVLIPIKANSKKPAQKGWQKLTLASMRDPRHIRTLGHGNIGVVLGHASDGLCTIDIDDDSEVEPFLEANPILRETLRTKRVRGCNVWVRIVGQYPSSAKLRTANGRPFGEWRADGNQTVIFGEAIDKQKGETKPTAYQIIHNAAPALVRFEDLVLPGLGITKQKKHPIPLHSTSCVTASLRPCVPASLHNTPKQILERVKAEREALAKLKEKHSGWPQLYERFIAQRFQAAPGERNAMIVESVPFLFRATAPDVAHELVMTFYDCNRLLFHDPRNQHQRETEAMLRSVAETYRQELDPDERAVYETFSGLDRDTFRICRDLAVLPGAESELTFFLSCGHCAARLGNTAMQSRRILKRLAGYGIIRMIELGLKRQKGVRGTATIWRWELSKPKPRTEQEEHF